MADYKVRSVLTLQLGLDQTDYTAVWNTPHLVNKANLRDLIAATGLVILLILDSNRQFFSLYDLIKQ